MAFDWNEASTELFRKMVAAGESYGTIANTLSRRFGFVSRVACIGKAHRLGIADDKVVKHKTRGAPPPNISRIRKAKTEPRGPTAPDMPPDYSPCAVTIMQLKDEFMCRWPLGEPSADMLYCGAATAYKGCSYCARHLAMAYRPREAAHAQEESGAV